MAEIRIILIGKTGNGKSRTGNSILGGSFFEYGGESTSITKECSLKSAERFGYKVDVVDTPGVFDTTRDPQDIKTEVKKSMVHSSPGPHAIVLCVSMTRFSADDIKVLEHYMDFFGEPMLKFTIVLFTKIDLWEQDLEDSNNKMTKEQYIAKLPESMRKFIEDCGDRFNFMDNRHPDVYTKELFETIKRMMKRPVPFYTNESFKMLERAIEEKIKENSEMNRDEIKQSPGFFARVFDKILDLGERVGSYLMKRYLP